MSNIGSIARVKVDGHGAVPSVTDDEIETNAWLIWQAVHEQRKLEGKRDRVENPRTGQPGYTWNGSVNRIVNGLWPALKDSRLIDGAKAEHIRITLNRYLRNSGNLYCSKEGNRVKPSTWWISKYWGGVMTINGDEHEEEMATTKEGNDVDGRSSSDVFDLDNPMSSNDSDETVTDQVPRLQCRAGGGCTYTIHLHRIRAAHEKIVHGIKVMPDGTIVHMGSSGITTEEVAQLIIDVARETEHPETANYFRLRVKERDFRPSKKQIVETLDTLSQGDNPPMILTNPGAMFKRYALSQTHLKPVKNDVREPAKASASKAPVIHGPDVIDAVVTDMTDDAAATSSVNLSHHITNLTEVIADLQRLNGVEQLLNDLIAENERVTTERDEMRDTVARLTEELDECRRERDDALVTLTDIKNRLFGGTQA